MSSPAQQAANRRNAAASTGPKSAAGKRKVSQNARTHGLRAQTEILSPADHQEIARITGEFTKEFKGPQVAQLAKAHWNLQRVDTLEDQLFDDTETNPEEIASRLHNLSRHRARHQRLFHQALTQCIAAQSHEQSQSPDPIHPIYPSQMFFPARTDAPQRGIIPLEWTSTTKSSASGVSARSAHSPPSSKSAVPSQVMKAPSYWCARTAPWPAP